MDEQEQEHPEGATGATGEAVGATVGGKVTDTLPESQRNYSGNLGNDTTGGPGKGTPPGNTSQRDATGGGAVSDTGSAAGAPIPQAKVLSRQGASGMGAAGSSADVEREEYDRTHGEDGELTDEAKQEHEDTFKKNKEAQEAENKRILDK